jgi:hypothetical protein
MVHGILQFTLRIAFRCVLHRRQSQEIRCRRLSTFSWLPLGPHGRWGVRVRFRRGPPATQRGGRGLRRGMGGASAGGFGAVGTPGNDPSAGSPTETLLRLLLPLNDRV